MIMIPIATQLIDVFYFVIYRAGRGMKKVWVGIALGIKQLSVPRIGLQFSGYETDWGGVHTLNCIGRKECSLIGTHNSLPETHCVSQAK